MKSLLKKIMGGDSLSETEAFNLLFHITEDNIHEAQIGAILGALRTKGESSTEISGFAKYLRKKAIAFPYQAKKNEILVDTCGTGGDDIGSFNISTAVAFVLASAGVKVAKHGNRSVSSRCGCADVLEELKIPLNLKPEESAKDLKNKNFTFLFAPAYHPSFKKLVQGIDEWGNKRAVKEGLLTSYPTTQKSRGHLVKDPPMSSRASKDLSYLETVKPSGMRTGDDIALESPV